MQDNITFARLSASAFALTNTIADPWGWADVVRPHLTAADL